MTNKRVNNSVPVLTFQNEFLSGCETGSLQDVRAFLCDVGVDVNSQDENGITGLMWSVINSRKGVFMYLLEVPGIDLNLRSNEGFTALQYAVLQVVL